MVFQPGNECGSHGNHARGFVCRNLEQLRGMRWVQKDDEAIRVPAEKLEEYLTLGWKRGRTKPSAETRKRQSEAQKSRTDRVPHSHTQDSRRDRQYKARYRRSNKDYDTVLAEQSGHCAFCESTGSDKRRLCWDHNHDCCPGYLSCGKCVRGLICIGCNREIVVVENVLKQIIGTLTPKPRTWTERVLEYLKKYPLTPALSI